MALDDPYQSGLTQAIAGANQADQRIADLPKTVADIGQTQALTAEAQARTAEAAQATGLAAATQPYDIQKAQAAAQTAQQEAAALKIKGDLATNDLYEKQFAYKLRALDPDSPTIGADMDKVAASMPDNPVAQNWQGRGSLAAYNRAIAAYGGGMTGGQPPNIGAAPTSAPFNVQALQHYTDDQFGQVYSAAMKTDAAFQAVRESKNPQAEWDKQAVALGHPELVGRYSTSLLDSSQAVADQHLSDIRAEATRRDFKAPPEPAPMQVEKVEPNQKVVGVTRDPVTGQPVTTTLAEGQGELKPVFGAQGPNGEPILMNSNPDAKQKFVMGPVGSQAKMTATQFRYQQAIDAGMTPAQALDVMNGKGSLTPQQQGLAKAKAQSQYITSMESMGQQVDAAQLQKWSTDYDAAFQSVAPAPAAAGGARGAAPPAAPGPTPQQHATAQSIIAQNGGKPPTGPAGTQANPWFPHSQAAYDKSVKVNDYYVGPDGAIYQRKK